MIEIVFPEDWSERFAWLTAVATLLVGVVLMLVPARFGRLLGLQPVGVSPNGLSELRGPVGGVWVGLGLACLMLAQPFTYFALGMAFAFAIVGRLISFVFDRTFNIQCVVAALIELMGAYFPLRFAFEAFGLV